MEELYNQLKQAITVLDANIFVEELQNYNGFKLTGTRGRRVRSFADVYVQNERLKIQISNIDYLDPKNLVKDSPNESWTLNKLIYVKNYDEINHALAIIEQSYLHVRAIVNEFDEYKDDPFKFVQAGPRDISFIFEKELDGSDLDHIVYETRQKVIFGNEFVIGMSLTIDNLEEKKVLWLNESQPNANKLFDGKVAKLMIYHGNKETYAEDSTQSICLTKDTIFISWRIKEIAYITNIIENLKMQKRLSIKVDIEPDDSYFLKESSIYNFGVHKISLTFNGLTDDQINAMLNREKKEVKSEVNRYREQWNRNVNDNFESIMPVTIYRITWKNEGEEYFEFWTESEKVASRKKYEIDHSNGQLIYVNFESWFAYRSFEHDKRFGFDGRELGWWEQKYVEKDE